jgi:hypothetical protein
MNNICNHDIIVTKQYLLLLKSTLYMQQDRWYHKATMKNTKPFSLRGLLEKYPTFGRDKETGVPGALDT